VTGSRRTTSALGAALAFVLTLGLFVAGPPPASACHAPIPDTSARRCWPVKGTPDQPTVVLLGDSHAGRLVYAVAETAREHGLRLMHLSKSGCPAPLISVSTFRGEQYPQCDSWRESALRLIESVRPAVVVTHSYYEYGTYDLLFDESGQQVPDAQEPQAWERGFSATLDRIAGSGATALVVRGIPTLRRDLRTCLQRARDRDSCGWDLDEAISQSALDIWRAESTQAQDRGWPTLDLTSRFCTKGFCSPYAGRRMPRFLEDGSHMTQEFATTLYVPLARRLAEVLPLAPAPVRRLRVSSTHRRTVVRWQRPKVHGSARITGYEVLLAPGRKRRGAPARCQTATTRCRIAEPLHGKYRIRVVARSTAGTSVPATAQRRL